MLNLKLQDMFNSVTKPGEFGLEMEVEGTNLPKAAPAYWSIHQDGSLRGEAYEYILSQPLGYDDVRKALDNLDNSFKVCKSTFNLSSRTSVHVHLNVQKWLIQEIYNLIATEFIVDNLLVDYSGPDRIGNLFCLRAQDAEYLPLMVVQNLKNQRWFSFVNDNIRYSSMNLLSLMNYGSVEFRSFRGSVDKTEILSWIDIIACLRSFARKHNDPSVIYKLFSDLGPLRFLQEIFPQSVVDVFTSYKNWRTSLERGSHYAFEIAYATNEWIDKEKALKAYKGKRRPGQCDDPENDSRFRGQTPEYIQKFLEHERAYGEFVNPGTGIYRDVVNAVNLAIEAEARNNEMRERIRQRELETGMLFPTFLPTRNGWVQSRNGNTFQVVNGEWVLIQTAEQARANNNIVLDQPAVNIPYINAVAPWRNFPVETHEDDDEVPELLEPEEAGLDEDQF